MDNINNDAVQMRCKRRMLVKRILHIAGVATISNFLPVKNAHSEETREGSNQAKTLQKGFIKKAFEMKQIAIDAGDQAYGAIIVRNKQIVGLGPSKVIINSDPTAHAEIEAIRDACRKLKTTDLSGCELYSTSKSCRMCETAGYWANVSRMYFGVDIVDGGVPQYPSC